MSAAPQFELPPNHPIIPVVARMDRIETSKPWVVSVIKTLIAARNLVEATSKKRDRSLAFRACIDRMQVGTELKWRK